MRMIDEAIVGYMRTNKRLVIPAFGAFLRKDGDGRVVFVEFLKKDDGVLFAELLRAYGLSAAEAAQSVEGFITTVRRQAASPAGYLIAGLGVMRVDVNGVYDLQYDPQANAAAVSAVSVAQADSGQVTSGNVASPSRTEPPDSQPVPSAVSQSQSSGTTAPKPEMASGSAAGPSLRQQNRERQISVPATDAARRESGDMDAQKPGDSRRYPVSTPVANPAPAGRGEEKIIKSPEPVKVEKGPMNLSEQLAARGEEMPKGMRYQKPAAKAHDYRKKKADIVMMIAIVAATIAIVAMIYGMMNEKMPELNLRPAIKQQTSL